jgi:hypothetical protein
VFSLETGVTYVDNPGVQQVTASMVKVGILADLLYQSQQSGHALTAHELALAQQMIEDSDDKAAQKLWLIIGQLPAMTTFNSLIDMRHTTVNWAWGLEATTPTDQIRLFKQIALGGDVLTKSSRHYEARLMEGVISGQRFGIPTDVPTSVSINGHLHHVVVGVKNGWYNEKTTGWQINSGAYVIAGGHGYIAVIMTGHDPSEDYGMDTVSQFGKLLWKFESSRLATGSPS